MEGSMGDVLVEGRATRLDGFLGTVGHLCLTDHSLTFTPRALERWVGQQGISVEVREVAEGWVEGMDRLLVLRLHDGRRLCFSGPTARALAPRLRALLDPAEEDSLNPIPDEKVLYDEAFEVPVNLLISAHARVVITESSLHVRQAEGFETRLLHVEPFSAHLGAIDLIEIDGLYRQLTLGRGGRTITLVGDGVPAVYAMVQCARLSGDPQVRLHSPPRPIARSQGPLGVEGFIAFGPTHFVFAPGGVMDAVVGDGVVAVGWDAVTRARLSGDNATTLTLTARDHDHDFVLSHPEEDWRHLRRTLLNRHDRVLVPDIGKPTVSMQVLGDLLRRWDLALTPGERPTWMRYVLRLEAGPALEGAWLLMTDRSFYLLPEPRQGRPGLRVPVQEAASLRTWAPGESTLRLLLGEDRYEFELRGGADEVAAFWSRCPLHSYQGIKERPVSLFRLPRLEGPVHFIRLHLRDRELLRILRPRLVQEDEGLRVHYADDQRYGTGLPREGFLDVADGRGVFRMSVLLIEEPAAEGAPSFLLALVSKPERVTHREEYRVLVNLAVRVREGQRAEEEAELLDLSGGGCALLAPRALSMDRPLSLRFELYGEEFALEGHVLRRKAMAEPSTQWRHGVQFASGRAEVITHLRQALIQVQRERVAAERAAEDEALFEAETLPHHHEHGRG